MVTDSLRYWAVDMGVDGFRFDLGTILARARSGFDERHGFHVACRQDPLLSQIKLIAEPWDCGMGGYQVGAFPPGWLEWNDRYRDTVRAFWRGDQGKVQELASRLTASGDVFNRRGRRPSASVNFVTAHDGFTLQDLVSYEHKHNEANGHDNTDGTDNNLSANYGCEGPTDDRGILRLRQRQMRNMMATLLFSQGTPMIVAGDELGHTQQGNNNVYCQDNEISWIDWDLKHHHKVMLEFTRRLIKLRHAYPMLRRGRFLVGDYNPEMDVKDVSWIAPHGQEMTEAEWHDPGLGCLGMMMDGRAQPTGIHRRGMDATLLLILNARSDPLDFTLPTVPQGSGWRCLIDTSQPLKYKHDFYPFENCLQLVDRSLMLFELKKKK